MIIFETMNVDDIFTEGCVGGKCDHYCTIDLIIKVLNFYNPLLEV